MPDLPGGIFLLLSQCDSVISRNFRLVSRDDSFNGVMFLWRMGVNESAYGGDKLPSLLW